MDRNWFYTTKYGNFGEGKATQRPPSGNFARQVSLKVTQSLSFLRIGVGKVSISKQANN